MEGLSILQEEGESYLFMLKMCTQPVQGSVLQCFSSACKAAPLLCVAGRQIWIWKDLS